MYVKPSNIKKLVAIDKNNKLISLSNRVMRKMLSFGEQQKKSKPNSICVTCNYRFHEKTLKWHSNIRAICHPFRTDDNFPSRLMKSDLAESDFCDKKTTIVDRGPDRSKGKYDFVYFTLFSGRGAEAKGLHLLPCIDRVAASMKLRGLVIDYSNNADKGLSAEKISCQVAKQISKISNYQALQVLHKKFSTEAVCEVMRFVRFVLFPNTRDASPRLISEATVRGVPVLVNDQIYGGWKYVNSQSGCFFSGIASPESLILSKDQNAIDEQVELLTNGMERVMSIARGPSVYEDYYQKYGFRNSCRKLAEIINELEGSDYRYVAYEDFVKILRRMTIN